MYQCMERKRTYNCNELQKLTPSNIREKNLMSRQQQHNVFNKNEIRVILKLFLTFTTRKNFVFIPQFRKQKPSLVSWFSRWVRKTVSWKIKNASYFLNHDTLIRTLSYALPFVFMLEMDPKNIFSYQCGIELY